MGFTKRKHILLIVLFLLLGICIACFHFVAVALEEFSFSWSLANSECLVFRRQLVEDTYTERQAGDYLLLCRKLGKNIPPQDLYKAYTNHYRPEWFNTWVIGQSFVTLSRLSKIMERTSTSVLTGTIKKEKWQNDGKATANLFQ